MVSLLDWRVAVAALLLLCCCGCSVAADDDGDDDDDVNDVTDENLSLLICLQCIDSNLNH